MNNRFTTPATHSSSGISLKELDLTKIIPLRFSGNWVNHNGGSSKAHFPPFVDGRFPIDIWFESSDSLLDACMLSEDSGSCDEIGSALRTMSGMSGYVGMLVSISDGNIEANSNLIIKGYNDVENTEIDLELIDVNNNALTSVVVANDYDEYRVYLDSELCATYRQLPFQVSSEIFTQVSVDCNPKNYLPLACENSNGLNNSKSTRNDSLCIDDEDIAEEQESVGNIPFELNYPTPETDEIPDLRNSLAWYVSNQDQKLFVAECTTRKSTSSHTVQGDPIDWVNVVVNLARVGVPSNAPIIESIQSCIVIATRISNGETAEEAITQLHCGSDFDDPIDLSIRFQDDYNFNELCDEPPVFEQPPSTTEDEPVNPINEEFVLNIPQRNTEIDASLRNSIAWYEANKDKNLYSIECATRPANGIVVGNSIIDIGLVVDTKTGITVADGVLGWGAVSNFLEANGVALYEKIQRSILGCNAILAVVEDYDTFDEAVSFANSIGWDDFIDAP